MRQLLFVWLLNMFIKFIIDFSMLAWKHNRLKSFLQYIVVCKGITDKKNLFNENNDKKLYSLLPNLINIFGS